jgi:hypothetical protein
LSRLVSIRWVVLLFEALFAAATPWLFAFTHAYLFVKVSFL